MLNEFHSGVTKFVTLLKVAALVVVLGSVVLAAEHRKAPDFSPVQSAAVEAVPPTPPAADVGAQQAATDYFPARLPAPSGPAAELAPPF